MCKSLKYGGGWPIRQDLVPGAKVTAVDCDLMDFESVRAVAAIAKVELTP